MKHAVFAGVLSLVFFAAQPVIGCGGSIHKLVNADGWQLPDVGKMRQVEYRTADGKPIPNITAFVPNEKTLFDFLVVSGDDTPSKSLHYSLKKYPIGGVLKYESNHKVYAYRITFDLTTPSGDRPGCVIEATISDEDGDGIFETYMPFGGPPEPPKWVNRRQSER